MWTVNSDDDRWTMHTNWLQKSYTIHFAWLNFFLRKKCVKLIFRFQLLWTQSGIISEQIWYVFDWSFIIFFNDFSSPDQRSCELLQSVCVRCPSVVVAVNSSHFDHLSWNYYCFMYSVRVLVFNATFNNISVILCRSVSLVVNCMQYERLCEAIQNHAFTVY
jgi:hypothetical protein